MSNSYNPRELAKQAEELFFKKNYDEIITLLNDGLLDLLKDTELYGWRAYAHYRKDEDELFEEWTNKITNCIDFWVCFQIKGLQHFDKKDYDSAIESFDKVISLKPDYFPAWTNRGNAWYDKDDLDKAIFNYDEAIRLKPEDAWVWHNRGNVWYDKGDLDKAIFNYNEAIRLNPEDDSAWYNRGNAWKDKADLDKAIINYNEAIRLKPDDFRAWVNRGLALYDKGDLDKAIINYNEAIRLKPDDSPAWVNRGMSLMKIGDLDQAIKNFDEAITLKSDTYEAWNNRGMALQDKGDLDQAIENYSKAVELKPDIFSAWYNMGNAWRAKGDFDQAIKNYDEAIRLNPNGHLSWGNRGVVWCIKGDFHKGITDLNKSIELEPKAYLNVYNRGKVKKKMPFYGLASIDFVRATKDFLNAAHVDKTSGFDILDGLIGEIHYSHPLLCQELIDSFIPVQSLLGVNKIYNEVESRTSHASRWLKVLGSAIEVSNEYQRKKMEAMIAYHAGNPVKCYEIADDLDNGDTDLQLQYYYLASTKDCFPEIPFIDEIESTKLGVIDRAQRALDQEDIDEEDLHYAMLILYECGRYEEVANMAGLVRNKSTKYLAIAATEKLNGSKVAQSVFEEIRSSELYQDYDLPIKKIEIKAPRIQEDVSELIKENEENVKKKLDVKKELPELIKDEIERNTLQRKEQLSRLIRYYEIEAAVNPYLASGEEVLRFCDVIKTNKLWNVMRFKEKMDTGDSILGNVGTKARHTIKGSALSDFDFHDGKGELGLSLSQLFIQLKNADSNEQFMKLFGVIIRSRTFDLSILLKFIKYFYLDGKFDEKELVYLFFYAINYQPIKFTLVRDSMKDITKSGVKSGIAELQDLLEWTSEITTTIASPFLAKYIEGFIKISNKGSDSGGQLDYNTFKMKFAAYIANQLEEFGENSQEYKILNQFDGTIGN